MTDDVPRPKEYPSPPPPGGVGPAPSPPAPGAPSPPAGSSVEPPPQAAGPWYWDGRAWRPASPPPPAAAAPFASPRTHMVVATVAITAGLLADLVSLPGGLALIGSVAGLTDSGLVRFLNLPTFAGSLLYAAAAIGLAIAVPIWAHRCHRNLPALGATGLHWSPAWAAGAWFIPFGNLIVCYSVVREIWRASGPDVRPAPLVWLWWAYWLAASCLELVAVVAAFEALFDSTRWSTSIEVVASSVAVSIWPLSWGLLALLGWQIVRRQEERFQALLRPAPA